MFYEHLSEHFKTIGNWSVHMMRQSLSAVKMGRGSPLTESWHGQIVQRFKNNVAQLLIAKNLDHLRYITSF